MSDARQDLRKELWAILVDFNVQARHGATIVDALAGYVEQRERAAYDRAALVNVVVYHHRDSIKGCSCGWSQLGLSWADHLADEYERAAARRATPTG